MESQTASANKPLLNKVFGPRPLRTIAGIAAVLAGAYFLFNVIYIPVVVDGPSMLPNYPNSGFVLVYKHAYDGEKPERGEVVLVEGKYDKLLKRVIGLPGEVIAIHRGIVFINGEPLEEPYVELNDGTYQVPPFPLLEGQYYVMGDNRAIPQEQHDFGVCREGQILGRVVF